AYHARLLPIAAAPPPLSPIIPLAQLLRPDALPPYHAAVPPSHRRLLARADGDPLTAANRGTSTSAGEGGSGFGGALAGSQITLAAALQSSCDTTSNSRLPGACGRLHHASLLGARPERRPARFGSTTSGAAPGPSPSRGAARRPAHPRRMGCCRGHPSHRVPPHLHPCGPGAPPISPWVTAARSAARPCVEQRYGASLFC
ncbi:hypothetical protein PVAP13_2KG096032, partial [Panicum virgatum]